MLTILIKEIKTEERKKAQKLLRRPRYCEYVFNDVPRGEGEEDPKE